MKRLATILILLAVIFSGPFAPPAAAAAKPSPDEVITLLKEGNLRFVEGRAAHPHTSTARLHQAGTENQGNHALATVIACSDSRVPVERIFDSGVMDTFVIRVAGNVVDVDEAGSIEYGLAHVNTPVLVVLGHTQCGAVTAVTHAVHGTGHALERNIPPLVDNIIPAVNRAMALHPEVHGDGIIPYAITENVWQGVEDLFMRSPAARDIVHSGRAKVVGAVYDVGTGKVSWLPEAPVAAILSRVEADPGKAVNAMADSGHGEGAAHGAAGAGDGHTEVTAADVSLADAATMEILAADWLTESEDSAPAAVDVPLSGLFWAMFGALALMLIIAVAAIAGGTFNRFSLNLKLYTSFGMLIFLAVALGAGGYLYLGRVNKQSHLETAFLDLDMMSNEIGLAQNGFLLHGIENAAYGEKMAAQIDALSAGFLKDIATLRTGGMLSPAQEKTLGNIAADLGVFTDDFKKVVKAYREIASGKEALDASGEAVEASLETLLHHHEAALKKALAHGNDPGEIRYQNQVLAGLKEMELVLLRVAHGEVEFLLDKHPDRVGAISKDLGRFNGYLDRLASVLKSEEEKTRIAAIRASVEKYAETLKAIIRDEALIEKRTAEMGAKLRRIAVQAGSLSHEAEQYADARNREADIALIVLILIAVVSGTFFAVFVSRGISKPVKRIIDGLNAGAEQVASASGQVSSASQSLAEGASEQAASIEGTVKKVGNGSELEHHTNDSFSQVKTSADKIAELVGEIAAASKEQAQGVDQINVAVTDMDKITQQNAASAEESASAAEEMNGQAEQMKRMTGELSALVGGGSREWASHHGRTAKTQHRSIAALRNQQPATTAVDRGEVAGKVAPAQIIPLDDGFDDF